MSFFRSRRRTKPREIAADNGTNILDDHLHGDVTSLSAITMATES